jgi:hypothetical protein
MPSLPVIPYTSANSISKWSNFHQTVAERAIPVYLTPDVLGDTGGNEPPAWKRQASAITAIIDYCKKASPPERLTTLGSAWSLSDVLDPGNVVLDPGAFNTVKRVNPAQVTASYQAEAAARSGVPIIVQGGALVSAFNHLLGRVGLALQTSGANDGHRVAGCIATGTHGSALSVGAVHDTVLAMVLVVDSNHALLLQPTARRFTSDLATWVAQETGLAVTDLPSDDLFHAAQVAVGSLGFVHSVIIETVPLYQLANTMLARPLYDPMVWEAMATLDTSQLDPGPAPYHFSVVLSPYAQPGELGAFPLLMRKTYTAPGPVTALMPSDTTRVVSSLLGLVDSAVATPLLSHVLTSTTAAQMKPGTQAPSFPGQVFGPTTLPAGNGRSTEIVVDHAMITPALEVVLKTLQAEAKAGRHVLGALGIRFCPATAALLGMNRHPMNCYIEIPSLGSPHLRQIYEAVWKALRDAKITFTCHWGQEYGMDATSLGQYFGDRLVRWKAARGELLSSATSAVFAAPLLSRLGVI